MHGIKNKSMQLHPIVFKESSAYDEDENPSPHRALTNRLTDFEVKFYFTENSTQDGHLIGKSTISRFEATMLLLDIFGICIVPLVTLRSMDTSFV